MAGRIRTIKPEVLEDEFAAALTDAAWRMWISMWTLADDHGNLRVGERYLAASVWQDTARDSGTPLLELVQTGFVRPYAVTGQRYGHISGWDKHQRVDNAGKARVPGPEEDDGTWDHGVSVRFAEILRKPPQLTEGLGGLPLARHARAQSGGETSDHDHDHDRRPPEPARREEQVALRLVESPPSAPRKTRRPKAPSVGETPEAAVWRLFRKAWSAAYDGEPYISDDQRDPTAARAVSRKAMGLSQDRANESGVAVTTLFENLVAWWVTEFLELDSDWLAKFRHPLTGLTKDIRHLGVPEGWGESPEPAIVAESATIPVSGQAYTTADLAKMAKRGKEPEDDLPNFDDAEGGS